MAMVREKVVINNLLTPVVLELLRKNYDNEEYTLDYAESVVENKDEFHSLGKFDNGNELVDLYRCDILGVVDGASPKGVEAEADVAWRKNLLRQIGYKL